MSGTNGDPDVAYQPCELQTRPVDRLDQPALGLGLPRLSLQTIQASVTAIMDQTPVSTGQKIVILPPDGVNRALYIFLNNRHGTFEALSLGLPEVWTSAAGWADFDNDGRLDFLVAGNTHRGVSSRLYKNNHALTNRRPDPPSNLSAMSVSNGVLLAWNDAVDWEANVPHLTYNVGITPLGGGRYKSWSALGNVTTDGAGIFEILAPPIAHAGGFYRLASP